MRSVKLEARDVSVSIWGHLKERLLFFSSFFNIRPHLSSPTGNSTALTSCHHPCRPQPPHIRPLTLHHYNLCLICHSSDWLPPTLKVCQKLPRKPWTTINNFRGDLVPGYYDSHIINHSLSLLFGSSVYPSFVRTHQVFSLSCLKKIWLIHMGLRGTDPIMRDKKATAKSCVRDLYSWWRGVGRAYDRTWVNRGDYFWIRSSLCHQIAQRS